MLIATFVWWMVVAVLAGLAVLHLWRGIVSPRALDLGLLPGTLVARLGFALGVLLTGGTVERLSLVECEAPTTEPGNNRWLRLRHLVSALLPIVACAAAITMLVKSLGLAAARGMLAPRAATRLPTSLAGAWGFLRETVDLLQASLAATIRCNVFDWRFWVFLYLLICLALRLAPSRSQFRAALLGLLTLGFAMALLGLIAPGANDWLRRGWPVLSLVVATNLLLLVLTLLARGLLELVHVLRGRPANG